MKKIIISIVVVVAVAIVVGAIFLYLNRDHLANLIVQKGLNSLQVTVLNQLPTDEKKEEVRVIFKELGEKIKSGTVDPKKLQDLGYTVKECFEDKKLDEKETEMIVQKLKAMVGPSEASP